MFYAVRRFPFRSLASVPDSASAWPGWHAGPFLSAFIHPTILSKGPPIMFLNTHHFWLTPFPRQPDIRAPRCWRLPSTPARKSCFTKYDERVAHGSHKRASRWAEVELGLLFKRCVRHFDPLIFCAGRPAHARGGWWRNGILAGGRFSVSGFSMLSFVPLTVPSLLRLFLP